MSGLRSLISKASAIPNSSGERDLKSTLVWGNSCCVFGYIVVNGSIELMSSACLNVFIKPLSESAGRVPDVGGGITAAALQPLSSI